MDIGEKGGGCYNTIWQTLIDGTKMNYGLFK